MPDRLKHIGLVFILALLCGVSATAQKFSVSSFRELPNDVTAFINPVNDLNDEGCALIKVQASPDFAFSTPLGIVKRENMTGEIWLYVPNGTKKITLKHPEWGVLRDYAFPSKLVSHRSYEMRIEEPARPVSGNAALSRVVTVHDTLLMTRVDTLLVHSPKKRTPLRLTAIADVSYGGNTKTLMGGLMIALMRAHGGFAHISTDFGSCPATSRTCDRQGYIGDWYPYYADGKHHSAFIATGGAIHRLSRRIRVFEGIGYGSVRTVWQLAESEGGEYVRNKHYSHRGVAFEAGAIIDLDRFAIKASVSSIKGTQWFASIGVGINIGKL